MHLIVPVAVDHYTVKLEKNVYKIWNFYKLFNVVNVFIFNKEYEYFVSWSSLMLISILLPNIAYTNPSNNTIQYWNKHNFNFYTTPSTHWRRKFSKHHEKEHKITTQPQRNLPRLPLSTHTERYATDCIRYKSAANIQSQK